jgi:hypothetical protein
MDRCPTSDDERGKECIRSKGLFISPFTSSSPRHGLRSVHRECHSCHWGWCITPCQGSVPSPHPAPAPGSQSLPLPPSAPRMTAHPTGRRDRPHYRGMASVQLHPRRAMSIADVSPLPPPSSLPATVAACSLLIEAGQVSTSARNEMVLLSDVLGVESLVDMMEHARSSPSSNVPTESAILGPFYKTGVEVQAFGTSVVRKEEAGAAFTHLFGTVRGSDGKPLKGAMVDVWHDVSDILRAWGGGLMRVGAGRVVRCSISRQA